ncbi:DNA gyrase inhibitor YacG [Parvularcula marina]|uniref:DNA gyrase inhibitor YacG n=1 Tax=Parvularcula marina TaxID=2292771 RepID=A0A371RHB1_9PROT|nr:DNA gyrase inhibitor YacG [Parvularcula marina]RFB04844.1 DNA gyrase inhibitor YacG [Parvularcula marina]
MSKPDPKCPICGKSASKEDWPFCSDRCRKVDLNRWLSEGYAIPGAADESAPTEED